MDYLAYLDAGTGSVFIQAILGAILAGSVIMRNHVRAGYHKIKALVARKKSNNE